MDNYQEMENFLTVVKQMAFENPDKEISSKFIYSILLQYGITDKQPFSSIKDTFDTFYKHFESKENIHVYEVPNFNFLLFDNGQLNGNEIKMYLPFDKENIVNAVTMIFDFMAKENITHQSKIANIIRNDNLVIRVNSWEDAQKIRLFVETNPYLKNNLMRVNPFLPNQNGIGITMDNNYSFNSELSKIIANFINILKAKNRLQDLNVATLNVYIQNSLQNIQDLDQKDIYTILAKTTNKNFNFQEFEDFAKNKSLDMYDNNRERITNPDFYLEHAVKITEKYHPGFSTPALQNYIKGNASGFTRKENARGSLIKYVKPDMVMPLINKYLWERGITYSNSSVEAISQYVNSVLGLKRENNINQQVGAEIEEDFITILKQAYIHTKEVYSTYQANEAMKNLLDNNNLQYFTNNFQDRSKLAKVILNKNAKEFLLTYLNDDSISLNDTEAIIAKFIEIFIAPKITNPKIQENVFSPEVINPQINENDFSKEINNPEFYLEYAVKITEKYYPGGSILALQFYTQGDSRGFTRKENARGSLIKYVKPDMVMPLINKYLWERGITYSNSNVDAICQYVNSVLELKRENNINQQVGAEIEEDFITILKQAYIHTMEVYDAEQATEAMRKMLNENNLQYFTNQFQDRSKLKKAILNKNIKETLLTYLNDDSISINDTEAIIAKFSETIISRHF